MLIHLIIWLSIFSTTQCTFKIGGLFQRQEDANISMEEKLFTIATRSEKSFDFRLRPEIFNFEINNSIEAEHFVCSLLKQSVIGIFGPLSRESAWMVKSISDTKEIPHIQTRYDNHQQRSSCGINLYPHPSSLSKAVADVIKTWGWKNFIVIYENNESLIRISDLLKPEVTDAAGVKIIQLPATQDYRSMFRQIRQIKETNILLDCSTERLPEVLVQSQQTGLMITDYNYIITCLDLHTLDLQPYQYSGVNITGFRLINPSKSYVQEIMKDPDLEEFKVEEILVNVGGYFDYVIAKCNVIPPAWYNLMRVNGSDEENTVSRFFPMPTEYEQVEAALLHDAVNLFKKTIMQFKHQSTEIGEIMDNAMDQPIPTCDNQGSWKAGFSIVNAMKVTELLGLTGWVKFDYEGFRTNIELQIIELTEDGIQDRGIWNTSSGVHINTIVAPHVDPDQNHEMSNTTFRVIISLTKPYGMRKPSKDKLEGNERFEGFAVDFVYELSLLSNFKYELIIEEDSANGEKKKAPNGTEYWDGMIGALLSNKADLAIADLTMSKDRAEYVEFSTPFMDLGIAILYIKPKKENPSLFSFLFPFSDTVWFLVFAAYIGVSLQFYIMARLSPYEWTNPYPCIQEPEELENQFTLGNSFWFTSGALMQQGSEIAPISPSTRMAAGIWWFFTLIMVSSYTANLAAFLTVENEVSEFKNAQELARQKRITYGAKDRGTTKYFFRDSNVEDYKHMYAFMSEHPELMTESNEEGVKKVLEGKGDYAFLMESSAIDYEKEQHCELAQIGPLLDNKNYGIAMRKDTWYSNTISRDVLVLQEKGILSSLKRKWWKEKYSKNCQEDKKNDAETLKLGNVGGVFLVLIAGVCVAFLVMLYELMTTLRTTAKEEKVSLKRELARELKFIMRCQTVKPARRCDERSLLGSHSENNNSGSGNGNGYDIRQRLKNLSR